MTDTSPPTLPDLSSVISNTFGEHCLYAINRNAFQDNDASTVFRTYFGENLFSEHTFYIIAGTDSGLLYQYIKKQGAPKGSRYLLIELPQILERLTKMDDPEEKLVISTPKDWQQQAHKNMDMQSYALQDHLVLVRSLGVVHSHYSGYPPFWRQLNEQFRLIKQSYAQGLNHHPFTIQQLLNLTENQTPQTCLKNSFQGKTAVVLAGGPSLDEFLPWVRKNRKNLLVIAVARISKSLLQANIQPDICVAVDPYHMTVYLNREMYDFQDDTLLANEYHVSSTFLSGWGGKKTFSGPRYPWETPLNPENLPPSAGGTVTNSAFDIAIETGVTQIILGGVDFCYSQTGHTHTSGTAEHALGSCPMSGDSQVKTNSGKIAHTRNDLLRSAQSIEIQAKGAVDQGCTVINPSPDSARLAYVEHLSVDKIKIEPLEKSAAEIITNKLPADDSKTRTLHYNEVLGELDRVLGELRTIKGLCLEALNHNSKLFDKNRKGASLTSNSKIEKIEKKLEERYGETAKFIKLFGLKRFVFTLKKHEHNKEEQNTKNLKENNRYYFLSITDTCKELIDYLQQARNRTLSRLEEEKPQANLDVLIKQWQHDDQPGRAIQWAKQHKDYIEHLPENKKQALHTFQNTFDDSIEKHGVDYFKSIEDEATLEGMSARAREYFQNKDEEGLTTLQTNLKEHHDKEQAEQYLLLVQGYLAELHDETALAIKHYNGATEGPAQIDVLHRLFHLQTKNENVDAMLETLKTLSNVSPTYTPMYAELLNATGDANSAVEVYTDYLLNTPDDLNSVMKLGIIYYQHKAIEGVEWAMNYILNKDPNNQAAKSLLESLKTIDEFS